MLVYLQEKQKMKNLNKGGLDQIIEASWAK